MAKTATLTKKDLKSDQEVRWCPGCGDYAILNTVQGSLAKLGIPKENLLMVSGIGCSSRFPYYVGTYGLHSIHGRAPAFATAIKACNPELSVWLVTGDGDGMSIGGNHLIHALRRNVGIKILLFNNEIYGLTKGQYSPTSPVGLRTKSTPLGSIDRPFNPLSLALGAGATFVARTIDTHAKHMAQVLEAAAAHEGTAFIEIYQNCVIFNDGCFDDVADKSVRDDRMIDLVPGQPMVFGKERDKGLRLNGTTPEIVDLANGADESDLTLLPIPIPVYRGSFLNFGENLDQVARGEITETRRLRLGIDLDFTFGEDSADIAVRQGMPDLDFMFELGPELEIKLDNRTSEQGEFFLALQLRAGVSFDGLDPSSRGFLLSPELEYRSDQVLGGDNLLSLRWKPTWASEDFMNYYYEVEPMFATAERPAYDATSGYLGSKLTAALTRQINARLIFGVSASYYLNGGAENEASPLYRSDSGASIQAAFVWTLAESERRATRRSSRP